MGDGGKRPQTRGLQLVAWANGRFRAHPLPDSGQVTVGRDESAEVRLDDQSVSRAHARLEIGRRLQLRDLGSANGTQVHDRAVGAEAVEVRPGDLLRFGGVLALLQCGPGELRRRRVWPRGYLALRVDEECGRSDRSGAPFAVVQFHIEGVDPEGIEAALGTTFRPADLIACEGPSDYAALVLDADPAGAEAARRRVMGSLLALGGAVRSGLACSPRDGRVAEVLLELSRPRDLPPASERHPEAEALCARLEPFLARLAAARLNVLLLGEAAPARRKLAERLHALSPEASLPLVRIDCVRPAEIPSQLQSAPLGATLLLDHVAELPPQAQATLAAALPDGSRLYAATHRDLAREVERGRFRLDLYQRLDGMTLVVPRSSVVQPPGVGP